MFFAARKRHGENVLLADNTADAGLTFGHLQLMEFCCIFTDGTACLLYLPKTSLERECLVSAVASHRVVEKYKKNKDLFMPEKVNHLIGCAGDSGIIEFDGIRCFNENIYITWYKQNSICHLFKFHFFTSDAASFTD